MQVDVIFPEQNASFARIYYNFQQSSIQYAYFRLIGQIRNIINEALQPIE